MVTVSEFDTLYTVYPNLALELMEYFWISNPDRLTVLDFCKSFNSLPAGHGGINFRIDPQIIVLICDKLCKKSLMGCMYRDNSLGINNKYAVTFIDIQAWKANKPKYLNYYNSVIYGFKYIYEHYRNLVVPVLYVSKDGDYSIGTGFKYCNGIVTARHCVEGAMNIAIKGYQKEILNSSTIYISHNENVDIAYINIAESEYTHVDSTLGEIMQEVLTLGYPKIPAFTDFLAVEKATISSIAERLTPSKGDIVAISNNYLCKLELMLITAKIRGGNSGGPVVNDNGAVVGVAIQIPSFEGDYDDLGYGIVAPIKYANNIVNEKKHTLKVKDDFFIEFT